MASRVAGKIKLQSVDELLGVPEIAGTQEIEIGRIHAFPNHPFKVLDDEKMDTLVDSIRENGILTGNKIYKTCKLLHCVLWQLTKRDAVLLSAADFSITIAGLAL